MNLSVPPVQIHNNILMKTIIIIWALIVLSAHSFLFGPISPSFKKTGTQMVGGFPNKISFGSEKANALINFINSASTIYRDDIKQNLLYIHACMTAAFEN